jgi:BirA family transcriptional regulator, biotin operon repressor / biotin---[acetyl-CoA-carboxylase] ligase
MNIKHTIFTGKRFIHLQSTPSTNQYAFEVIAKTNPIDGTVIFADNQYQGKGQPGNSWYSEEGKSLTFSIVYKTGFLEAVQQAYLNFAISLGILQAMRRFAKEEKDLTLKWPNDLFYKNRKFGGILIENTLKGMYLENSVVGIGINIGSLSFPEGIKVTFAEHFCDKKVTPLILCEAICEEVEIKFLKLKQGLSTFSQLKLDYENNLWGKGKQVKFSLKDGSIIEAVIMGVDEFGRLKLNIDGKERCFDNKELALINYEN